MPKKLSVLLDENIAREVAVWLRALMPHWTIYHTAEVGLNGKPDRIVFDWGQSHQSVVITFDDDFADQRSFPVGKHYGIVRLRIWPTTVEETQKALARLVEEFTEEDIAGSLIIIDRTRIRVRQAKK